MSWFVTGRGCGKLEKKMTKSDMGEGAHEISFYE